MKPLDYPEYKFMRTVRGNIAEHNNYSPKRLTERKIAEKLGIHYNTLGSYYKHPETIPIGTMFRLAEIAEITQEQWNSFFPED